MRVILEGLTGAGKSSTIAAMRRLSLLPGFFAPEEETLGEVWDEIQADAIEQKPLVRRLDAVIARLHAEKPDSFLLERFHFSYFSLVPTWSHYDAIDSALHALGVTIVLLTIPEEKLRERSLMRREHGGTDWQGMISHFGSEAAAIEQLRASQERRLEALAKTRLPAVTIDTSSEDWESVARAIASGK